MVFPKLVQLYKNQGLAGDSGDDEVYKIKTTDQILALYMSVRMQNGATRNVNDAAAARTVEAAISKIEVKSGSTIFKSFTGEVCRKIASYRDGVTPETMYTQAAGGTWAGHADPSLGWQQYMFPMYFTPRNDPYGVRTNTSLPAPLYKDNLDLSLTYSFPLNATSGFATGQAKFDLYALVVPPEPSEVMRQKNIIIDQKKKDHTTVASGDEEVDLTVDTSTLLRQVSVFCYENQIGEGVDITDLKFRINNETKWEAKWGQLQALNAQKCQWNPHLFDIYTNAQTATDEIWTRVPAPFPYMISGTAATVAPYFTTLAAGDEVTITTDAQGDVNLIGLRSPVIPAFAVFDFDLDGSMMQLPGGHPNNAFGDVRDMDVILVQGAAGGDVDVVEQLIKKPWNI